MGSMREGPVRVYPGRLSVSRTFGDIEAKRPEFGGMPNVIIAEPDIRSIPIVPELDWILLGCDGIWDVLSNAEVSKIVWNTAMKEASLISISGEISSASKAVHEISGRCVDAVMEEALNKFTTDNITVVFVAFQGFLNCIERIASGEYGTPQLAPKRKLTKKPSSSLQSSPLLESNARSIQNPEEKASLKKYLPNSDSLSNFMDNITTSTASINSIKKKFPKSFPKFPLPLSEKKSKFSHPDMALIDDVESIV